MIIEFNETDSASIKSFAVKKKIVLKATTRFMSGKLLLAKLSLKSFTYSLTEILSFPDPIVKKIYEKYQIDCLMCYHILTDMIALLCNS